MKVEDLDQVLNEAVSALQANKAFLTPDMLPRVQALWDEVKSYGHYVGEALVLTDEQSANLVATGDKIMAAETALVTDPNRTANIVEAINGLRARPIIMRIVAALLE